ncbi:MAG: hypothetical protein DRJ60_00170 [Thermoprotei archaeon]|nr:MAG: hypothetical protein DRJ60_00170 [Thermoprotei archaeon]
MMLKIVRRCPYCYAEVELHRHPMLPDVFEGYCEKCKVWVKRHIYYCSSCEKYTLHQLVDVKNNKELWECEECGSIRHVYVGLRRSPQRSLMPT